MLLFLKKLFRLLTKIDKFLREDQIKNLNGFTLIVYSIFAIGAVGVIVQKNLGSEVIIRFTAFIFGLFFYTTIPYIFFKSDGLKQYIVFGKKKTYEEIFKEFTLKSYVIFVMFFSYFAFFPVFGIPILLKLCNIDIASMLIKDHFNNILYINVIIASFFWFAYYIVESDISLQRIRTRVALFTALGTTFTVVFNSNEYKNFLFIMSCLLLSYLWVQYLIEAKSEESSIVPKAEENI